MNRIKIIEQFHYFNIQSNIDSVYGNWAVSSNGDIVNSVYPYAIFSIHFNDKDWIEVMRTKVWFRPECEKTLNQAIQRANEILNNNKKND